MRWQLLLILTAGLLLAADPPNQGKDAKPQKDEAKIIQGHIPYYTRVEIQGILTRRDPGEPLTILIPSGHGTGTSYPMSVNKLKDWTEKKLHQFEGRIVHVTGTLELLPVTTRPGATEDRLGIVARTLVFLDENTERQ